MQPAWTQLLNLAEPYRLAFEQSCARPRIAQEHFLQQALAANTDTDIGRRMGFAQITTAATYVERVPTVRFPDIEERLAAWQTGRPTLCAEPVVHTEWTSGSTREAKAIPYSAAGLEGFRNALLPWLSNLCRDDPTIATGRVYWALSPAGSSAFSHRPAGNDAAYFGEAAPLLEELSAVPLGLASLADVESWRLWTTVFLAACNDLSFISIWSPTFLHPLLDMMEQESARIADAMLHPDRHAPPEALAPQIRSLKSRARHHAKRLRSASANGKLDTRVLWPALRKISCWTHGAAARHIPGLARRLAGVVIEPKGLLSTEAAVSLPMAGGDDPVAAVNSNFLELQLDDGRSLALWDWQEGDEGRMVITTRSGLWRYETGDRVRITGFRKATPCLLFLGRDGKQVDLCGEKLDEILVQARLPAGVDAFLAPQANGRGYYLFVEATQVADEQARVLAEQLDASLCEILHYRHARELGQLTPLHAVRISNLITALAQRGRESRGTPLATIKTPALDCNRDWFEYFSQSGATATRQ